MAVRVVRDVFCVCDYMKVCMHACVVWCGVVWCGVVWCACGDRTTWVQVCNRSVHNVCV
jgi:hypothetical protein